MCGQHFFVCVLKPVFFFFFLPTWTYMRQEGSNILVCHLMCSNMDRSEEKRGTCLEAVNSGETLLLVV